MAASSFELAEATITDLQAAMASGALAAGDLAAAFLARIESIDRSGPELRSVIAVDPDAVASAAALDDERSRGRVRGPLHGIPVLIKDNIETEGEPPTTVGSLALEDARAGRDATVVARLRSAGAVILGKANLSEWANFRSTASSSGWSALGGQCRNPYALDRNPCGSSSGSAVAVASNLCVAAIGTETDGSIVCPSSINGIAGVKPTVGAVSRAGVVPVSHTQDTPGPMARTLADAAIVLDAIAGADDRDPATRDGLATAPPARHDLRGVRLGVGRNLAGFHAAVDALFEEALDALRELGAELVDPADVPHADELEDPEMEVLLYDFKADLEAYLAGARGAVGSLVELIAFNEEHRSVEMPFFGQELFEKAVQKGPLTEPSYLEALATCGRLARDEGLDAALSTHGVDAIVAPSGAPAWLTDHVNGDHFVGGNSSPAAVAGYPSVTVPMGSISGLPVGISLVGGAWRDRELISIASAFERATRHRRPPTFAASVIP